tara:strand:- start:1570 stop:2559 length:990 start_codon:yes stop_codon:yes gene_type:complete
MKNLNLRTLSFFILIVILNYTIIKSQVIKEIIYFESANPFSLSHIISGLNSLEKQKVFGKLTLPLDSIEPNKKFPLVIGVAGSRGWKKHHLEYIDMYQKNGFATFELNSFKSRDVTSTVGSQVEVTIATIILDAYRALKRLSNHPNIDPQKVGITGWSLGGGVALFSGWQPVKNAISKDLNFAAHLPFYPPCFINPKDLSFTNAPYHILIGESDNWTPAEPCKVLVEKLSIGTNIDLTLFPNAHHGFDSEEPVHRNDNGYSFSECLFDLTKDGDILMNYLKIPMTNSILQKIGFLFCVKRGVDIGGNLEARKKSFPFALQFMRKHLKNN